MHRPLEEQRENGGPDVRPAATATTAATALGASPATATETTTVAGTAERETGREAEAPTHVCLTQMTNVFVPHDYLQSVADS